MALTVLCLRAHLCSPAYTAAECTDIDKYSGCLLLLSRSGSGKEGEKEEEEEVDF